MSEPLVPTLEEPPSTPVPRRRRVPIWPFVLVGILLLLGGIVLAAWNVTLPYLAFEPGPVRDVSDLVSVDDHETHQIDGDLFMLTVATMELNGFDLISALFDDAVDVYPKERVRPPEVTEEEFARQGLAQMDASERTAIAVALRHLGYEVALTGDGARVVSIVEGAPADGVLQEGDVITGIDGDVVEWAPDLVNRLASHAIGDTVSLTVDRGEDTLDLSVTLVEHTQEPGRPMVGILAETENERLGELPFEVEIDSSNIGGPSAGFMYALTLVDLLTEDDLLKGHTIAGTGTIDSEGNVGGIGGVRQKVVAAERQGADYVLVPEANYEDALSAPTPDENVISVATLQDALDFLESLDPAA